MNMLVAHLELSDEIDGKSRERCPDVVFVQDGVEVARVRTDIEEPALPFADGVITHIDLYDDALSRVIDEEAWLQELHRILTAAGTIRFTLPMAGALAWLDAMNLHRYAVDIGKRGTQPNAARPTGWNRHYTKDDIVNLCKVAELTITDIRSSGHALDEAQMAARLFVSNWLLGDDTVEQRLFPRFGRRSPDDRSAALGTTWVITAQKA